MKNISIEVDEATLAKAEIFANAHHTSVPGLLLDYLHEMTSNGTGVEAAKSRLLELSRSAKGEVGERKWTRDDLYGR